MASKSKRKKQPNRGRSGIEKLERQLQANGIAARVVSPPPGGKKLSEALLDLVTPFKPYADTLRAFRALVGMGVAAWNLPLLDGPERETFLKKVVQPILTSGSKEDRDVAEDMFNTLVKRKERYFAGDKRVIVSYHVSENRDGFHVAVATTLVDPHQETDK